MADMIFVKKQQKLASKRFGAGFTLVDVLVGVSLLVIVFAGIFGAYQLGLKTLNQSQRRVIATALANEMLEQARNLPYAAVGVQGAFPDGSFLPIQVQTRNEVDYQVAIDINYVADDADGLSSPDDSCINDYKRMLATVSWAGRFQGNVKAAGDISPQNEIQECGDAGGLLRFNVFDAQGLPVSSASVDVQDVDTALTDVCATNAEGACQLLLPASPPGGGENYKIQVTKTGYSSAETLRTGDSWQGTVVSIPEDPHATLLEGEITSASFAIDQLGTLDIETRSSRGRKEFTDLFDDASLLSSVQNTEVQTGNLQLDDSSGAFPSSGTATSVTITDVLVEWGELSFQRALPPQTGFSVQVLYHDGAEWTLVPEEDLPGNSAGFSSSSVVLSSLDIVSYPSLRLQGNLSSTNPASTPAVSQWSVSYFTLLDFPLGNIPFHLKGAKIVGQDASEQQIAKYDADHATGPTGSLTISNVEWDSYTLSVDQAATGLSIVETAPSPQPISLSPNTIQKATLYLSAENSLLVTVQELGTGAPIFSASARVTGNGYDVTQLTDGNGQTLFIPLDAATYTVAVTAEGYQGESEVVLVAGNTNMTMELELNPE